MKKKYFVILFVLSLNLQAQFVQVEQKALVHRERARALSKMLRQPLANTGNYDVKFHRIELIPSLTSRDLEGTVTTYFVPNQDLTQIEFDFITEMTVQSVSQRGTALTFNQVDNKLIIDFPQAVTAGTLDSLSINYSGEVPNTGFGSYNATEHNGVPVVWTLSEPYGARDWWPCKQDLTDKADSVDIVLKYPKTAASEEMFGVSNGLLADETTVTETDVEYKISTWKHRYPITAYLVAFAITNYTKFSETAGIVKNFPIDNYVYPENLETAQSDAENFLPVMNYFEETFGHYPFYNEKYGQIQFGWGGGMEHQTATFLVNYSRSLVAHELAHQWFGDAITCGSWHDIWINEGFATYGEALTREALDGEDAFKSWKQWATSYITQEPGGSVYVQDTTDVWRIFDYRLSYVKGAMVLNMLRLQMGETDFFQGLKNYVNHKSFGFAKIPDFKIEMEAQSGQDLNEFFNDWIYGAGYPTYEIQVNKIATQQYEVVVSQTTSDPSVSFFEMDLPFQFVDENGQVSEIKLSNTENEQHFIVDLDFEATDVIFDPDDDIVKGTTSLNVSLISESYQASQFQIYPNPSNKYFYILNETPDPISEVKILSLDGKQVKQIKCDCNHINVSDIAKGVYFLQVKTEKIQIVKKIIVQ